MNILFLTISRLTNIRDRGIYTDLMRKFRDESHKVYIVSPRERQYGVATHIDMQDDVFILGVSTLNLQKTNVIEKGIGTVLLEGQFDRAIKKYLSNVSFDLIIYSTPPITFPKVVLNLKRRFPKAITYLLLKDIFPQNAVDLRMLSTKNPIYWYFRMKEKSLYKYSDYIGCMSPANVKYVLDHNPFVPKNRVEVCPNSIELTSSKEPVPRDKIRERYNLPLNKPILIYGGNLGKPQGIDFLIRCMAANKDREDCHFLIVGSGTEYGKLERWYNEQCPRSVSLFKVLPKEEYDDLVRVCDIGLIFLDHRFTIPNYPSRLLSYLECKMPVIVASDKNSDIGTIAEENGYGYWCESVDTSNFTNCVNKYLAELKSIQVMGEKGNMYLRNNYLVSKSYSVVLSHFTK